MRGQEGMLHIHAVVKFPPGVVSFPHGCFMHYLFLLYPQPPGKVTVSHWPRTRRALKPATIHHGGRHAAEGLCGTVPGLMAWDAACLRSELLSRVGTDVNCSLLCLREGRREVVQGSGDVFNGGAWLQNCDVASAISKTRLNGLKSLLCASWELVAWGHAPIQNLGLFTGWPCPLSGGIAKQQDKFFSASSKEME